MGDPDDLKTNFPPTSHAAIAFRLQLTREALGLSKTAFASGGRIALNTYIQWESGDRKPDLPLAIRLCDRFGLSLDWLYRGVTTGLTYALVDQMIRVRRDRNTTKSK